jgi:hypothetical protein
MLEVPLDVVVQRLERRDVEELNRVRQGLAQTVRDQRVELPQECRERLAGAGRREDKRVRPAGDRRPPESLWIARDAEGLGEPPAHLGMERAQYRVGPRGGLPRSAFRGHAGRAALQDPRQQVRTLFEETFPP